MVCLALLPDKHTRRALANIFISQFTSIRASLTPQVFIKWPVDKTKNKITNHVKEIVWLTAPLKMHLVFVCLFVCFLSLMD